jgi:restriction endonuclease S subunit
LQKSELEKRLDPAFYFELRNNKFEFAHPSKTISRIVKTYSGGTPNKSIPSYWDGEICWASPKDMKGFYLSDTQDRITVEGVKNSATIVAPSGSVLIVFRSGILQHTLPVCVTKVETSINQDLKVLVPSKEILPEYLATFLKTYEKRILPRIVKHSTTVQSINQEEFNQLLIPIPTLEIQKKIIDINQLALEQKQQNEAEAEKLLANIDDYLLNELGIALLGPSENTLKNRMFIKSFRDITGSRFDPNYFALEYTILDDLFEKYNSSTLGELSTQISDAPHERPEFSDNEEVRVIMIEHLKPDGIQMTNEKYITQNYHLRLKSTILQKDDLLMARIGVTTGVTSKVNDFFTGMNISGNITLIRLDHSKIYVNFILEYLNSYLGRLYSKRILSNSARDFLTVGKIKSIRIPIIPITKQKEIADRITAIRQQAQQLKDKTKEALAQASREIEDILLK